MSPLSAAFTQHKLCVDFAALKTCCPKGIYVAPVPVEPLIWSGVLFVRDGPYENAILRFQIDFPIEYPQKPPIVTFQSDVFHPLVSPLTTYTYSARDFGADTQSAADEHRLPPGGVSLRHGFPEWFPTATDVPSVPEAAAIDMAGADLASGERQRSMPESERQVASTLRRSPHIVEILQYLRIVFDTAELLDAIPLAAAANAGAWHAWRSFRSKTPTSRGVTSVARSQGDSKPTAQERSLSPRQQPGGARRPGEWNWQGVWEERVRRCIQASLAEPVLFSGGSSDVIAFRKVDEETLTQLSPLKITASAQGGGT